MMQHKLTDRCLLVSVSIRLPSKSKQDRAITQQVLLDHNAAQDAGRFVKNLFPEQAIKPIQQQAGVIRQLVNDYSLPWTNDGQRILPCAAMLELREKLNDEIGAFDRLADASADQFEDWIAEARRTRNGMFNRTDYPVNANAFRRMFHVECRFLPLPDAAHVVLDMAEDEIRFVQESTMKQVAEAADQARADLMDRIAGPVRAMVDRLAQPDAVFRDTLVTNIKEIAALIPALNITNDRGLAALAGDVAGLAKYGPDTLRHNKRCRRDTAQQAASVLAKLQNLQQFGIAFPSSETAVAA